MYKKINNYISERYVTIILILLIVQMACRIIIYHFTELFYFQDYQSYLKGVDEIFEKGSIPLIKGNFLYILSYIGYFFKYKLGSIHYFFLFNSMLAVISSYINVMSLDLLGANKVSKVILLFLYCIYIESIVWSSIFYTPIIMIFLLSSIIYLILYCLKIKFNFIFSLLLCFLIAFSLIFKSEMRYFPFIFFIFSIFLVFLKNKQWKLFLYLSILSFIMIKLIVFAPFYPKRTDNSIAKNDFIFFGHTLYGGDGGDGSFIYEENEKRYNENLKKFIDKNKINIVDQKVINQFQMEEVKKFIKNHPFGWIKLQTYKFFRFWGIIPEGSSYKVMVTGITKNKKLLTAGLLSGSFGLLFLLFLFTLDYKLLFEQIKKTEYQLIFLLILYYIGGSVFYGHYQERYRLPIMMVFILPLTAIYINNLLITKKIKYKISLPLVSLFILMWGFQAYDALVIHKNRYFNTSNKANELLIKQ